MDIYVGGWMYGRMGGGWVERQRGKQGGRKGSCKHTFQKIKSSVNVWALGRVSKVCPLVGEGASRTARTPEEDVGGAGPREERLSPRLLEEA